MSKDCLVTKLKGTVNNDSLPIFDSLVFIVPAGYDKQIVPYFTPSLSESANPITVSIIEGTGVLYSYSEAVSGQEYVLEKIANSSFKISTTTDVKLKVTSPFDMNSIMEMPLVTLEPIYNLVDIVNYGSYITEIKRGVGDSVIDIDEISDSEKPTVTTISSASSGGALRGDVKKLGVFTSVTFLRLWEENASDRHIHGNLIDFVTVQKGFNRSQAVITCKWLSSTNILLNNTKPDLGNEGTIEWDSNYIIVRGETSMKIYSYNASSAQIEQWEQQGYEVIPC